MQHALEADGKAAARELRIIYAEAPARRMYDLPASLTLCPFGEKIKKKKASGFYLPASNNQVLMHTRLEAKDRQLDGGENKH
jgi:hypothetical protein